MAYDPSKSAVFRDILKRLATEGALSSAKAIQLVEENRAKLGAKKSALPPFRLSRSALDRFRHDQKINDTDGLSELWRVLESHEHYAYAFMSAEETQSLLSPERAMALGLARFFSDVPEPKPSFHLKSVRKNLAGKYTMYRPGWNAGNKTGAVMTSLVEVFDQDAATSISETQNYQSKDERFGTYYQKDSGFLFAFGKYVYFLMKEEMGGITVKLGVVESIFPLSATQPVTYFYGMLFVTSQIRVYPAVKFFCSRLPSGQQSAESKQIELKDVPDKGAAKYLADSLLD